MNDGGVSPTNGRSIRLFGSTMEKHGLGFLEHLFNRRPPTAAADNEDKQDFILGLKQQQQEDDDVDADSNDDSSHLSPLANSIVARCSKILNVPSPHVLEQRFQADFPHLAISSSSYKDYSYGTDLLEYCSYKALHLLTHHLLPTDYLTCKDFHRFTFDIMLAWEQQQQHSSSPRIPPPTHGGDCNQTTQLLQEDNQEDGWSLFYTNSITMAAQVDDQKTVGPEAFARIAPACPAIADIITVHNLFDSLTTSSASRLHFLMYDKYLGTLDRIIKTAKCASGPPLVSNLQLAEGEIILLIDGTVPTQPVLQHIGKSAWPGRLTLTNYALYFESGVGLYDKPVRYDLAMEKKQVIKPELTGPLGARLFDNAVMYKSTFVDEPVYLEFPEFKGHSRRDYWLENTLEVLHAHRFVRKYNLKETQKTEALSKSILGIFRLRAVKEAFHIFPSHYKTLLGYSLAEKLPRGDIILETLSNRMKLLSNKIPKKDVIGMPSYDAKRPTLLSPIFLMELSKLGFNLPREAHADKETETLVGDVCVGETNPLELAVKQSKCDTSRAEMAQATVQQVKVEGIDTNIAVMKELLFPVIESVKRLQFLASWEDPFKSTMFLLIVCFAVYRDWIKYALPCLFVFLAMLMLWRKHRIKDKSLEAFTVTTPSLNAVEQLLALQEAISHFETYIQAGNIVLLKLRALLFSALPQATDMVVLVLIIMAVVFAFMPLKVLMILIFLETYARKMPLMKDCSEKRLRRAREWWIRIPAAPVRLIKRGEDSKS